MPTERDAIMQWLHKTFPGCEFFWVKSPGDLGSYYSEWFVTISRAAA